MSSAMVGRACRGRHKARGGRHQRRQRRASERLDAHQLAVWVLNRLGCSCRGTNSFLFGTVLQEMVKSEAPKAVAAS